MKKISTLLGLSISFASVLPVIAGQGQPVKTKSFIEWCQSHEPIDAYTQKTIFILLEKAGTNDCQLANSRLRELTKLDLSYSGVFDVIPLASLTNLTTLNVRIQVYSGSSDRADGSINACRKNSNADFPCALQV
jgi:internalin A